MHFLQSNSMSHCFKYFECRSTIFFSHNSLYFTYLKDVPVEKCLPWRNVVRPNTNCLNGESKIKIKNTILTTILINLHDRICLDTRVRAACGRGTTGCPTSTTCTWRGRRSTARRTSRPSCTQTSGMLFSAALKFTMELSASLSDQIYF